MPKKDQWGRRSLAWIRGMALQMHLQGFVRFPPHRDGGEAARNRAVDGRFPLPRARVAYSF